MPRRRTTRRRPRSDEPWCTARRCLRLSLVALIAVIPLWMVFMYMRPVGNVAGVGGQSPHGSLRTFVPTLTDAPPVAWKPDAPAVSHTTVGLDSSDSSDVSSEEHSGSVGDVGGAEEPVVGADDGVDVVMPSQDDTSSDNVPPLFPPGTQLDNSVVSDASRHPAGVQSWASKQLDPLFDSYAKILAEYPSHIREVVNAMPPHRFKEIRRGRLHYDGVEAVTAPEDSQRSGFTLSNRYGSNSATASNVCFDKRSKKLLLYRGGGGPIINARDHKLMTSVGHAGFKWTWKVEEKSGSPPGRGKAKWYKGMSVLASPAFSKHVTHFSEAVTFVFHANLHPRVYPWWAETKRVVHVKIKDDDYPWSREFMKVCMSAIPNYEDVGLIWANKLKGDLHCFERAGLMAQQTHEYGYHADPWEAQVFREMAFKLYDVPEPPRLEPNQKIRTTILDRKGRKKMVNPGEVVDVVQQTELAKFDFLPETKKQPVYFEKDTTFRTQIMVMRHTDVLIGLHGSGLNNAMFMEPGSVVIAIMPSNYVEYEWHNFITGSGSTYLFQPTTDNKKHSTNCKPYPKKCDSLRPFQAKTSKCLPMWYCDAKVDVGATEVLFRQTNFLIRNMKREITKSEHAMPFNGGRNPAGKVAKLDD